MNLINRNKTNSQKNKIIGNIFVYLLIIFSIIYFIIIPTTKDIKEIRDVIISQKIEKERVLNREKNISNLSIKIKKIEPMIEKLDNVFIDESKRREFISTLENIAQKSNVTNTSISPQNNKETTGIYETIPLTISATGKFDDIMKYLKELEKINYYINIQSFDITTTNNYIQNQKNSIMPDLNKSLDPDLTIKINADTYWEN